MSFYDYLGPVGSVIRLAQGDTKNAALDFVPGVKLLDSGYSALHGANNEQKQGYYTAADQARQLGEEQKAFQMQGLGQAEGYFGGARARLNALYGTPSAGPPPGAPPAVTAANGPSSQTLSGRGAF